MTEIKVGSKVKFKKEHLDYGSLHFGATEDSVFIVSGIAILVFTDDPIAHFLNYGLAGAYTDRLELVEEKVFTKADLKDGMRVHFRNDVVAYFRQELGSFIMTNGTRAVYIFRYREDFEHDIYAEWDILSVYALGELIWEREEETPQQKELTKLKEQAQQLNAQIKKLEETLK